MPVSSEVYYLDPRARQTVFDRFRHYLKWKKWGRTFAWGLGKGLLKTVGAAAGPLVEGIEHGYKAARFGYKQLKWRADDMAMAKRKSKYGGKRKRTGGKKTLVKRSRVVKVVPSKRRRFAPTTRRFGNRAGSEYSNAGKMRYGRRRRIGLRQVAKQIPYQIVRYQAARAMNNTDPTVTTVGKNALSHFENITGDGFYPLHVYDLMGMGQANTAPAVAYQLQLTASGFANFVVLNNGVQNDGVTGAVTYQEEYRSGVNMSTINIGTRYVAHEWYDIRFNLFGCRTQPTVFDIMLVTFTQDECDPLWTVTTPPTALGDHRASLYQALVQPMVFNPIMPAQPGTLKGLKILKRKRVTIQASRNDEQDVNPSSVQFKMFIRDGRVCDYAHEAEKLGNDNLVNDGAWVSRNNTVSDYRSHPRIRARRWLFIRALNTTNIDTAVQNSLNTPSYDIIIRRKTRYIEAA